MLISRGLADPKSHRKSNVTTGKLVNIPVLTDSKRRRLGNNRAGPSPSRIMQLRGSRNGTKRTNHETAKVDRT